MVNANISPGTEFREWVPSWFYQVEGFPITTGQVKDDVTWIMAGWMYNDRKIEAIVWEYCQHADPEYLFRIDGQFILALYSHQDRSVQILRDRIGTFPIEYAKTSRGVSLSVDFEQLRELSSKDQLPSISIFEQWPVYRKEFPPYSPFKNISGLAPENSLIIKGFSILENRIPLRFPEVEEYKDLTTSSQVLGEALSRAVQKRIDISKRIGAFLSGGNDSSLVVALIRKYHSGPLKTLFVTFDNNPRDYGNYAREVSEKFSTDHSSIQLSPGDYMGCWADTVKVLQMPVPMPCHVGIHHALKTLSGNVDLMIDGDGADTVFGSSLWPQMIMLSRIGSKVPQCCKTGIANLVRRIPGDNILVKILRMGNLAFNTPLETYPHVNAAMISEEEFGTIFLRGTWRNAIDFRKSFSEGEFYKGFFSYLMLHGIPEDLAIPVRLGLSQGIFFTYPFLDYELLNASMRMPNRHRYHYRIRKAPLKKYSLGYFDSNFVYKPKEGFGVPLSKWFTRKEFEPFLMLPLEERSLKRGWWKEEELRKLMEFHKEGKGTDSSAEALPWIVINMELWARICLDGDSPDLFK